MGMAISQPNQFQWIDSIKQRIALKLGKGVTGLVVAHTSLFFIFAGVVGAIMRISGVQFPNAVWLSPLVVGILASVGAFFLVRSPSKNKSFEKRIDKSYALVHSAEKPMPTDMPADMPISLNNSAPLNKSVPLNQYVARKVKERAVAKVVTKINTHPVIYGFGAFVVGITAALALPMSDKEIEFINE